MTQYPADDVLLARGKYATVRSDVRKRTKELHERMRAIADQGRLLLQFDEEPQKAATVYAAMQRQVTETGDCLAHLAELEAELNELRQLAWAKEKEE